MNLRKEIFTQINLIQADAFKLTASIAHLGEMTFKQKGREESCEMDDPEPGQKICKLYLIENWQLFYGNFIRPKIKVEAELHCTRARRLT